MGVNNLWSVLAPVKKHKSLDSLRGQTLAIDLSLWICESQAVKQMQGIVIKPFLRNLFFRVNHLLQLGINLVFVIDGRPPKMKADTIRKRLVQKINDNHIGDWRKQPKRTRFNAFLRECCCLLDCLGIPYLESVGEAESYCAFLNAEGIVNACLTDDGDAFLYGAKEIYRNFTMDSKDPHVESYDIRDIESQLEFNRNHLVAFALLCGCDYLPKGVPKIGVETTLKLFKTLGEKDILSRFQEWRSMKSSEFSNPVEANVRNKALSLPEFPHEEIIKEFLVPKDKLPKKDLHWKRPHIKRFQEIAVEKLGWTEEYALEKIVPLVTKWTLLEIVGDIPSKHHEEYIVPEKIVKTRIKQGIPCFEVIWKNSGATDESAETYITIEEEEMFRKCYPYFVEEFSQLQISKSQAKNKEPKKKKKSAESKKENLEPIDKLLQEFEKLHLIPPELSETKSCKKESAHHDSEFHTDHLEIQNTNTKLNLSGQSVSSSIVQQAHNLISSENNGVKLKTDFSNCNFTPPKSDDKYFLTSQKKQHKEFHHSTNNERYRKISPLISPLYALSPNVCHNSFDESHIENIFSPVFHKLQCQYLLSETKSETMISNDKPFSLSSDVKLRNKQILNSFKVSSQSTPKAYKCHDNKDDETQCDPGFVFSHRTNISNTLDDNSLTDSFILQATQVDHRMDNKDKKLMDVANNTSTETFNDREIQKNSFPFSKDDSMQLTSNHLFSRGSSSSNGNLNEVAGNLSSADAHRQENHDLSSLNQSQFGQEPSILFLNDTSLKSNDSVNLNEIPSGNDVVQCNRSSRLNKENKLKQDRAAPLIYIEDSPVKDSFKITDSNQITNDFSEITKVGCISEIKHILFQDSQKLAHEDDKNLKAHSENHENFQDGNLPLDKNLISTKRFTERLISDDESFNEHKSLLGLSSTSINDSKLISTNSVDQDLLPYSSFENDSLTIKALENTFNSTSNHSLGQFVIQTTFLNDSCENQSKN